TVNYSWREKPSFAFMHAALGLVGKNEGELDYLGDSGTFAKGMSYTMVSRNGDDYLVTGDGREIMRVPYGIEQNAISVNAHVNSWFADFHRNLPNDYQDAVRGVEKCGGLCVINHPGEYSNARYELYQEDAYNLDNLSYRYLFQKFYGIIDKYDSCIGIDINSKGDDRTRYERKLWDLMLAKAAESGKTVLAIASSDAHQLDKIDTGSTIVLAGEKTSAALKSALKKGETFPYSTCICNYEELVQIADSIKEFYGETELYSELCGITEQYDARRSELAKTGKRSNVGERYKAIDDEGSFNRSARPVINSVTVDDSKNTIKIDSSNALLVRWISDGKVILNTTASKGVIDLDDYSEELGGYIRAEVFGEGGMLYTQSFTLNAQEKQPQKTCFINLGVLDVIIPDINNYAALIIRAIKGIFAK
ncbi:MAG: hypothetical protein IJU45_05590, partial [Clostridia bacterium]|nr:hypothetical protein [Clostridia bacterium]